MLWLRYEYGARNEIPDMLTSNLDNVVNHGQAAAEPHEIPLPARFAKQNQRMIAAARAVEQQRQQREEEQKEPNEQP
jgi:hypothetical protein